MHNSDSFVVNNSGDAICTQMRVSHVHATNKDMGYFLSKCVYFDTANGAVKGHVYKSRICMQNVSITPLLHVDKAMAGWCQLCV